MCATLSDSVVYHLQVPPADNYFAALNSAVFTDGSFVYIPKGVKCPMELSTYFRINAEETGQVCIMRFANGLLLVSLVLPACKVTLLAATVQRILLLLVS